MEITKFKKDKNNTYQVILNDDTKYLLYDDVIVKYNLLINKILDEKKLDEILEYNDFLKGYYKSIKYINIKLRSESELRDYLKKVFIKDVDKIVDLLYKDGYLNEEKYMIAYINDKYNLTNCGPLKISNELNKLGFKKEFYYDYLYNKEWLKKIESIVNKKIKMNHNLSNNMLKNKIINDVVNLGYEKKDIINILDDYIFESDADILIKELGKIKSKYSKKYSDGELKVKVINYLYRKGFNINDIKRCYDENEI